MNGRRIEKLNQLLEEQLRALKTYDALGQARSPTIRITDVRALQEGHALAAQKLRQRIERLGGKPVSVAGAWDTVIDATVNRAQLNAEAVALRALQDEEQQALYHMEKAMLSSDLPEDDKYFIRGQLLPKQEAHIGSLRGVTESH